MKFQISTAFSIPDNPYYPETDIFGTFLGIVSGYGGSLYGEYNYGYNGEQVIGTNVLYPALVNNINDVLGNDTEFPGRAKYNLIPVNVSCVYIDLASYISFPNISGLSLESYQGTSSIELSGNNIICTSPGTLYNIILRLGEIEYYIPLIEKEGFVIYQYNNIGEVFIGEIHTNDIVQFWSGVQSDFFHGLEFGCNVGRWSVLEEKYIDERTSTNLLTNSVFNSDTGWNKIGTGSATNIASSLGPDSMAYSMVCTSNQQSYFQQSHTVDTDSGYVFSVYIEDISAGIEARNVLSTSSGFMVVYPVCEANPTGSSFGIINTGRLSIGIYAENSGIIDVKCGLGTFSSGAGSLIFSRPQLEKSYILTSHIPTTSGPLTDYNHIVPGNPNNPGYDCLGRELFNNARKFNKSASYKLQNAPQLIKAVKDDFFDENNEAVVKNLDGLREIGKGNQVFFNKDYGLLIYDQDQINPYLTKILNAVKPEGLTSNSVFAYIFPFILK